MTKCCIYTRWSWQFYAIVFRSSYYIHPLVVLHRQSLRKEDLSRCIWTESLSWMTGSSPSEALPYPPHDVEWEVVLFTHLHPWFCRVWFGHFPYRHGCLALCLDVSKTPVWMHDQNENSVSPRGVFSNITETYCRSDQFDEEKVKVQPTSQEPGKSPINTLHTSTPFVSWRWCVMTKLPLKSKENYQRHLGHWNPLVTCGYRVIDWS